MSKLSISLLYLLIVTLPFFNAYIGQTMLDKNANGINSFSLSLALALSLSLLFCKGESAIAIDNLCPFFFSLSLSLSLSLSPFISTQLIIDKP